MSLARYGFIQKIIPNYSTIPSYFCLEWNGYSSTSPDKPAYWSATKPDKQWAFECSFEWRHKQKGFETYKQKIFILGTHPIHATFGDNQFPYNDNYLFDNIAFLKSQLQKAYRLTMPGRAVRTAKRMLELDPLNFFRRLPNIILEDSISHPHLSTIVWLMIVKGIVKNGLEFTDKMKSWILGFVYHTASLPHHNTFFAYLSPCFEKYNFFKWFRSFMKKFKKGITNEKNQILNLLISIQARRVYGGMKNDIIFMDYLSWEFSEFLMDASTFHPAINNDKIPLINLDSVVNLRDKDVIYSAIDFHINYGIVYKLIEYLYEEYGETAEYDDIKRVLWLHSSSETNKKPIMNMQNLELVEKYNRVKKEKEDCLEIWEKIKEKYRALEWGWANHKLSKPF